MEKVIWYKKIWVIVLAALLVSAAAIGGIAGIAIAVNNDKDKTITKHEEYDPLENVDDILVYNGVELVKEFSFDMSKLNKVPEYPTFDGEGILHILYYVSDVTEDETIKEINDGHKTYKVTSVIYGTNISFIGSAIRSSIDGSEFEYGEHRFNAGLYVYEHSNYHDLEDSSSYKDNVENFIFEDVDFTSYSQVKTNDEVKESTINYGASKYVNQYLSWEDSEKSHSTHYGIAKKFFLNAENDDWDQSISYKDLNVHANFKEDEISDGADENLINWDFVDYDNF